MKILRITAQGLPRFKELDLCFYATQRVNEEDQNHLYEIMNHYYLHSASAFIGINASGKTSILKAIDLALHILNNEPINYVESKIILGGCKDATLCTYFYDEHQYIYCLETIITAEKTKNGAYHYSIQSEKIWKKSIFSVKSKKYLTDFTEVDPAAIRDHDEPFLPDDVSFIISYNKKLGNNLEIYSLSSFTNRNGILSTDDVPFKAATFLDVTIEQLYVEEINGNRLIHLKFKDEEERILNHERELEQYLSSGTIKGILTFSIVKEVFQSGGYLLMDDIESHLNREVVSILMRFFMDHEFNKNGATLIFTTHDPELLDVYERNDGIYIVRNRDGITAENLSKILKRNDVKKSDAYRSDYLKGTAPTYEGLMRLKKGLASSIS